MSKKRREKRRRPTVKHFTLSASDMARIFLESIEGTIDCASLGRLCRESPREARARIIRMARRFATVAAPDIAARLESAATRLEVDGESRS